MTTPINVFKTYTANLTPTSTTVYTTPNGYTSIVLLAQISNTSESTISVTSDFVRSSIPTNLIKNGLVPRHDAINIIGGKLILQTGDSLKANASISNASQMIISIIESINP